MNEALSLAVGVPLTAAMLAQAARRVAARRAPWAPLAVAAVAVTNVVTSLPQAAGARSLATAVAFVAWALMLGVYPDGRALPRPAGVLLGILAGMTLVAAALGVIFDGTLWLAAPFGALLTGLGMLLWRYARRASITERDAARWLLAGAIPALTFLAGLSLVVATTGLPEDTFTQPWAVTASTIAFWLVPIGAAVGLIERARPLAERAVLIALVAYLSALTLVEAYALAAPVIGPAGAAALVALLEIPVLLLAHAAASVLVYGRHARPALQQLGARLEGSISADDIPGTVADAVRTALGVPYAAVRLGEGVAESGAPPTGEPGPGSLRRFPVVYDDREVAVILAAPRPGERALGKRDEAVLARLAARSGAALHGAAVVAELRATREDLLRAREEERRRLRRDLHDDLAPTLAGLGMRAAAVATLTHTDSERAAQVASDLESGIRRASEQVRQIAHGLRPPVLDDQGLVAAITDRIRAPTPEQARLEVTVHAAELGDLPAAVELAALRIVTESVANTRRHAFATTCTISLARQDSHLVIDVTDDGRGFNTPARPGLGLASIADRASELGGTSTVTSTSHGTSVTVTLPLRATP